MFGLLDAFLFGVGVGLIEEEILPDIEDAIDDDRYINQFDYDENDIDFIEEY